MKRRLTVQESPRRELDPPDSEQDSDEASESEDTDGDFEVSLESESSDASSDCGESTEKTEDLDEWKSTNGQIVWHRTEAETLRYFPEKCAPWGPTRYATSRITSVKSCFDLFITDEIIQLIVDMTNVQGRRSVSQWKDIDATDLQAYIGLLLLAAVYKSRNESTCSLWGEHTGRAIFRATMSLHTFSRINSHLWFDDRQTRPAPHKQDKLAAFRTIWEKWKYRLPLLFNPGSDVCVDDQLVPFKGRCVFRQYMPRKPAKYGIKIWVACDVLTSYAWKMQIYTGKTAGSPPEVDRGKRVVLDLTEGLEGNTVTCDNFLTSYALAEELLKRKLALVGKIGKNKPELPPQLLQTNQRAPQSSLFAFTRTHTAVSYIPKKGKNVLLLSTKHREPEVSNKEPRQPKIILDYNSCKGGVDNFDKSISTYSCRRRTCRWPLVLFYNILDVSALNAFVLWTALHPSWNNNKSFKRRLFMEELGKMLVSPQMQRTQSPPHTPAAAAIAKDEQESGETPEKSGDADYTSRKLRRPCQFCTGGKRKIASTCNMCNKHICKDHTFSYCSSCGH
ncbi:piggyBac transposable element-derived protein 3-like [Micropterus salmoides]|uniref:piggyBac transposable element-derived protein 3-like n=1 Tax=Micropterus salmoides TaxID=27706 RepID=UPI0018EE164D|nr:piggyBac transposable element-derived protein 3-like [Micropterus salmoides]XP_038568020.1 piggyBac transposable element-derived protein 3-like [Micropterus salmoides]